MGLQALSKKDRVSLSFHQYWIVRIKEMCCMFIGLESGSAGCISKIKRSKQQIEMVISQT